MGVSWTRLPRARSLLVLVGGFLAALLRLRIDAGFLTLRGRNRSRGLGQRVETAAGLREGDDVADRVGLRQQGDDAVPAESDAAVRRGTELEGVQQEAELLLGLLLAALMQRFARSTWVRSMLLLPWLVPNVAIALIWGWLLDSNIGFVTHLLSMVGVDGVTFYNANAAMPIVAGINIWAYTGYTALLLYAGMLQIPGELYESASLDGAGETRMFFGITLPLLRPVLVLVLVMGLIGSFQIFDTVQIGYAGHPIPAVRVIYYYIYQQGFTFLNMGYASAVAMLLVVVLAIFTAVQLRLMRAGSSDLA